jgi:hypothetical protein
MLLIIFVYEYMYNDNLKMFSYFCIFQCCCPGYSSRIQICSIPDPNFSHPVSASKNLNISTQKTVSKLSQKLSGFFIPDPDFLPIPDPGSATLVFFYCLKLIDFLPLTRQACIVRTGVSCTEVCAFIPT